MRKGLQPDRVRIFAERNGAKSCYLGFITNPKNGRVKALSKACLDRTYLALVSLDDARFVSDLIFKSINEDPATSLTEGRLIKRGWSSELDHYYEIQLNFNKILDEYLEEEKNNNIERLGKCLDLIRNEYKDKYKRELI